MRRKSLELCKNRVVGEGKIGHGIMFSFELNEVEDTEVQCLTGNWKCKCRSMGLEESYIE